MRQFLVRLFILVGVLALSIDSVDLRAQSKKKLGGPTVEMSGMKSQVYDFWKVEKADKPIIYRFSLPEDLKSDKNMAELTVQPCTGKDDELIEKMKKRWEAPKGLKLEDITRVTKEKVGTASTTTMLTRGTYTDDKGKKVENARLLYTIFENKDNKYEIILIGPFKTVGLHIPDVQVWVKNFK